MKQRAERCVGQFDGASVTGELKPLAGTIVTVEAPVAPATAVAAVVFIVKVGPAPAVSEMVVLADSVPLVPVTVSE